MYSRSLSFLPKHVLALLPCVRIPGVRQLVGCVSGHADNALLIRTPARNRPQLVGNPDTFNNINSVDLFYTFSTKRITLIKYDNLFLSCAYKK